MIDIFLDSLLDSLKLLPFLFLSYLVVEYLEHHMTERSAAIIHKADKAGPLLGSLIGIIPQCGFSAAAAGLFAGGVISPGTLLAVFLSTSDEMLPIMLSEGAAPGLVVKVLILKVLIGTAAGMLVDVLASLLHLKRNRMEAHLQMCREDHCGCEEHGIVRSALHHTGQVAIFLFLISLLLGFAVNWFGQQGLRTFFAGLHGWESLLSGLIGLIPNCAASVLITQLYLDGILPTGAFFAGILCGAGTGLLVLFRENRSRRENLTLTALLYAAGTISGLLITWSGLTL